MINNPVDAVGDYESDFAVIDPVFSVDLSEEKPDEVSKRLERVATANLRLPWDVGLLLLSKSE